MSRHGKIIFRTAEFPLEIWIVRIRGPHFLSSFSNLGLYRYGNIVTFIKSRNTAR